MYGCSAIIDGVFLCACMHRHVAMQLQCHAYTVYRRVGNFIVSLIFHILNLFLD